MRFFSRNIIRSFPELSELGDEECERLNRPLHKLSWRLKWIPSVVGLALWWGWMLVFGKGTHFLEQHSNWDLLGYLYRLGLLGTLAMLALSYGLATLLAYGIGLPLWRRLLKRAIAARLESKSCFWCGYCLRGLEASAGRVRCPECGDHSPIRTDTVSSAG